MAIVKFSNLFKKFEEDNLPFSFNELKNELAMISPHKTINKPSLAYDQGLAKFFQSSKECIIRNFCINPSILREPYYNLQILKDFYDFLNEEKISNDLIARCVFLVHQSKLDCSKTFMTKIFKRFSSIKMSQSADQNTMLFDELENFFIKIKKNLNFQNIITQLINEIILNDKNFNFEDLSLKFIDSSFSGLGGYAGINSIYVNTKPYLKILFGEDFRKFTFEEKLTVIKMDFFCLVIHESAHIALRFKLNDLNKSSPFLTQSQEKESKEEINEKILKNVSECGLECEKKIFKYCINWADSLNTMKLNLAYCKEFLKRVDEGKMIEFDTSQTEFEIYDEQMFKRTACYYRPSSSFMYR